MSAQNVEDVSAEDGHEMVEGGGYLLDVREADEWEAGRAGGGVDPDGRARGARRRAPP